MNDEKHIKTIRWDGTCKKCRVKTYWIPVAKNEGFICALCYWKKQDDITNGKAQECTVGELLEETRGGKNEVLQM